MVSAYNLSIKESSTNPTLNVNWPSLQHNNNKMNQVSIQEAQPSTSFSSPELASYDSIHSIKMPLHTLRKSPKYHPYFKSLKGTAKPSTSVPEVTKQMSVMGFKKEEKTCGPPKCTPEIQTLKSIRGLTSSPFFRKQV